MVGRALDEILKNVSSSYFKMGTYVLSYLCATG